jgi:WD40 repeat protein
MKPDQTTRLEKIRPLEAHIQCCGFSTEAGLIVAGAANGSLRTYDSTSLEPLAAVDPPGTASSWSFGWNACASCDISPGPEPYLVVGTQFGAVRFYDHRLQLLGGLNEEEANDPASYGMVFKGFEEAGFKVPGASSHPKQGICLGCAFSPDGRRAAFAWSEGFVGLVDLDTGELNLQPAPAIEGDKRPAQNGCSFAPSGDSFVTGDNHGRLLEWSTHPFELRRSLQVHDTPITCCAHSPDGESIAVGALGSSLRILGLSDPSLVLTTWQCQSRPNSCRFSPDGAWLLVGEGWGAKWATMPVGCLSLWDIRHGGRLCAFPQPFLINAFDVLGPDLRIAMALDRQMVLLQTSGVEPEPAVTTAVRLWDGKPTLGIAGEWATDLTAVCRWCRERFVVPEAILQSVRDSHWCQAKPVVASCPICHRPLRFNRFIVDGRASLPG